MQHSFRKCMFVSEKGETLAIFMSVFVSEKGETLTIFMSVFVPAISDYTIKARNYEPVPIFEISSQNECLFSRSAYFHGVLIK